jgi:leucyl aminopeptidase
LIISRVGNFCTDLVKNFSGLFRINNMDISIKSGHPEKQRTACVIIGVYEPRRLSDTARQLDEISDGYISAVLRRGDLEGRLGQTLLLHNVPGTLADRVLLVGCGREREFSDVQYRKAVEVAIKLLNDMGAMDAVCYLTDLNVRGRDTYWRVRLGVEAAHNILYRFDQLKTKKDITRRPLRKITFSVASRRDLTIAEQAGREGQAIADGMRLYKDLANLPPNICTPTYIAERAAALCSLHKSIHCDILGPQQLEELGMNTFLAVARGSVQEPRLIILKHQGGAEEDAPIVLVGKGVTFDSGGISLKPPPDMDEMKYDMSGAASVLGTLSAVADLQLPLNVIALMPCTENLPGGRALKPSDIITTMSGQTVEVLNTDAEGRLILCDVLTYSERFKPAAVIDVATLTGACIVALGHHTHALLGNHQPLINDLLNAGKASGDRAWELPLWDEYQEQLDSPFADMANVGGKPGGAITAACFLSRFAKKFHWAHLDIAGTAMVKKPEKGCSGRPVPLLTQYLLEQAYPPS